MGMRIRCRGRAGVGAAVALALLALPPSARAKPRDARPRPAAMSLEDLGREYRHLRALEADPKQRQRHLADLESWGGRMQQVMDELGGRLGVAGASCRRLVEVMGKPYEVARPGSQDWRFSHRPGATVLYLYWWRHHDLLYFEVRDDTILGGDWWMPFE